MGKQAAIAETSAPNVVTVEALGPVPHATYDVTVTARPHPPDTPNALLTINNATVVATVDVVALPNLRLRVVGEGNASVTVGPPLDSGQNTKVLDWARGLLRLQLYLGAALIAFGGLLAVFAAHQNRPLTVTSTPTTTTATTTAPTVPGQVPVEPSVPRSASSSTTSSTTSGTGPPAGATRVEASGGTTSSDTSLLQSVALAIIATGATLIPTGAAGILTAKINTPTT